MMPREKGSAVWNGAGTLRNTKPEEPSGCGNTEDVGGYRRRNRRGVKALGGAIRTYFCIQGF